MDPPIPKTTFAGYLKQIDVSAFSTDQATLFEVLFPRFYDLLNLSAEYRADVEGNLGTVPGVKIEYPKPPRRFGRVGMPRQMYYALSTNLEGADGGTLLNELR